MSNPLYDRLFAPLASSDAPFLRFADGTAIGRAGFLAMAHRAAFALRACGVVPGERVAAQVEKSPEALALYAGCVIAGAVFLPLNPGYTPAELAYFVGDAVPRLLVMDPRGLDARGAESSAADAQAADGWAAVPAAQGTRVETLDAAGAGSFRRLCETQPDHGPVAARGDDDLAALLYTSGTTGRAKGAMLSQRNLCSNAETLAAAWRFGADDVLLHALPIFHTHGLFVATHTVLASGASMLFLPGFDREAILRLLPQASVLMGVPTFYTRLLDDARFDRARVAHMRLFVSGSAPLLAETHRAFEERTGHRILERYGMTETNMNTSNPYAGERRAGTVGPPLPGVEIAIVDPERGTPLAPGETGLVLVRGPNVCRGYWNQPEKTREALREDGFFVTGDLGHLDADGYLVLIGRQSDLIISGGFNVYPKEVEQVLDDVPGVLESAVIGVPHPDFGEAVLAVLVADTNAGAGAEVETAIDAALERSLARYKHPKALVWLPALPRNAMGKVQKALLRERCAGRFAPVPAASDAAASGAAGTGRTG